jgi:hypothetical protein
MALRRSAEAVSRLAHSRLALAVLLLLAFVSLLGGLEKGILVPDGSQDFQWSGSRALLERRNPYSEFLEYKQGLRPKSYILTQTPNYPASSYVFLWPVAALPWPVAKVVWAGANLFFTLALVAGLQRLAPLPRRRSIATATALLLIATCYRNNLANGQHALFSLAFFVWSFVLAEDRKGISGLLLAISWLKYTMTFPLTFIFLSKKYYWPLLVASTIHVILIGFISWWIGEPPQHFVLKPMEVALATARVGDMDIFGILQRVGFDQSVPSLLSPVLFATCAVASMFVRSKDDLLSLCLLALISYTIFFHLAYDIILLIFSLWYCMRHGIHDFVTVLFAGLIGTTWYLLQVVSFVSDRTASALHGGATVLLYGTLVYLVALQFSGGDVSARRVAS